MENFKRSLKRFLTRLTILGLVVICGAIAIAQVQKQNNANAADSGSAPPAQLNFADALNSAQPLREQVNTAQSSSLVRQVKFDDDESQLEEPAIPGGAHFVHDTKVVQTQATQDFTDSFDEPFPASGSDAVSSEPPAPRFGAFDDGPPQFDDAPELANGSDVPPITDGPTAPDSAGFDAGFPSDFDAPLPGAGESTVGDRARPRARFGADVEQAPVGGIGESGANQLRSRSQAGSLREPQTQFSDAQAPVFGGQSERRAAPRSVATTAIAQPEPLQTGPPPNSSFGQYGGSSADAFAGDVGQGSVSIAGNGSPVPEFNGPQSASITIHKRAPNQVHVGEPATFTIKVRNNGNVAADRVIVRDQIPKNSELLKTNPPAKQASNGGVYWELDTLGANQERTLTMEVEPQQEGLIGSVAEVSFVTLASAQAEVRKPMLEVKHTTKQKVLVGETVRFSIVIDNPGSGTVKGVLIEEDVPGKLVHTKGSRLEYKVGDIPPGGQRRLELSLKAAKPGLETNVIRARGANGLVAEHTVEFEVIAPQLAVVVNGPKKRYLEGKATYTVQLENRGTAAAKNIDLAVQLPSGVKFISTESNGRYDASTHTVRWLLRELQPNKRAPVKLTVNPYQIGEFNLKAVATADRGLRDTMDHPLSVDGLAALLFEVADQVDPIEVGGVTTYSIQVTNQGTKEASDVELLAQVPPGMEAVSPSGAAKYQIDEVNGIIRFNPIARLAAKEKASYLVQVRGKSAGDQRFKVQMTSADTQTAVIEEESTRVYSDQ